jgi:hypothetical protein
MVLQQAHAFPVWRWQRYEEYDALECTLISRGYAGKHLGCLSELRFLADKVAWFLFEFRVDVYKGLGLHVIPPYASSGAIHKLWKTHHRDKCI